MRTDTSSSAESTPASTGRAMARETQPIAPLSRPEFIAMLASLMALNAISIDIMLPGLQQIGESLGVADPNDRQLVLSSYILGFGAAQLLFGPLADRFGRRKPLIAGLLIYIACAGMSAFAPSFASLLVLRAAQGVGAAATRVIAMSLVRDVYGGRQMAEIMSIVMMVFMIVPVIAPGAGQVIMIFGEWHMIFIAIALFGAAVFAWTAMRLPETLRPEHRRELNFARIAEGFRIVLTNRISVGYAFASAAIFGALFGFINSAQQIYVGYYDLGAWFPVVFALVAGFMALSSFLNSRLVGRVGMRRLSHGALIGFIVMSLIWLLTFLVSPLPVWAFVAFFAAIMFQFGWIGANFNALAMEPLGHVAGTASSVLGFLQTAGGGLIGATIGQFYDGTPVPMITGFLVVSVLSLVLVLIAERGALFRSTAPRI